MSLPPQALRKLCRICGMFSSDHDGERATAAAMADQFLRANNLTWTDVLHAAPPAPVVVKSDRCWRDAAADCLYDHTEAVSDWECEFLADIMRRGRALSARQTDVLLRIADKCGVPTW